MTMKNHRLHLFATLFLGWLIIGISGPAVPRVAGNEIRDPTIGGGYYRMVSDHNAGYRKPKERWRAHFANIRPVGIDGVYVYGTMPRDPGTRQIAEQFGMTPEEFIDESMRSYAENDLDVYIQYYWHPHRTADPAARQHFMNVWRRHVGIFAEFDNFRGFTLDEPGAPYDYTPGGLNAFREWLVDRYDPRQLRAMDLEFLLEPGAVFIAPAVNITVAEDQALTKAYNRYLATHVERQRTSDTDILANTSPNALNGLGLDDILGELDEHKLPELTRSESFRQWLIAEHTPEELADKGWSAALRIDTCYILPDADDSDNTPRPPLIRDGDTIQIVLPRYHTENPILYMEFDEFTGAVFTDVTAEMQASLEEEVPGAIVMPVLSFMTLLHVPFRPSLAQLSQVCGAISVDFYADGAQEEGFWAKLMRNQARGPSMLTICSGLHYSSGANRFARDLAMGMVHSPAVNIWPWAYIANDPPDYNEGMMGPYSGGNRTVTIEFFKRAEMLQPYLAPSESTARTALVYSERESMWSQVGMVAWPRPKGFVANAHDLHNAFGQLGIQYEPIFESLIDRNELDRYDVVILPGVSYLRPESVAALSGWIREGGSLVIFGATGTRDRWGRPAEPSAELLALTGASARPMDPLNELTLETPDGVITSRYDTEPWRQETLPAWEYEPFEAKAVGYWRDGSVAAVVNRVGDGSVWSFGAQGLPQCHIGWGVGGGGRRFAIRKHYFSGALEMIGALTKMAGGENTSTWSVQELIDCPVEVEVTVRRQPGRDIVHFINYSRDPVAVRGAGVRLRLPADQSGAEPVAFYPIDMSRAAMDVNGREAVLTLRDFDVHEMVVVQYAGEAPDIGAPRDGDFALPDWTGIRAPFPGRRIAVIGWYPGTQAEELEIDTASVSPAALDRPIDFDTFAQDYFMIALTRNALTRENVAVLEQYVARGGLLVLSHNAGEYEDVNRNYRHTWQTDRRAEGDLFQDFVGTAPNYIKDRVAQRVRWRQAPPFLADTPAGEEGEWMELQGETPVQTYAFENIQPDDIVLEADIIAENGQSAGRQPVALMRRHGQGWVLWDATLPTITATGANHPQLSQTVQAFFAWARDRSAGKTIDAP